jgi:hypothetical protein
MALLSGNQRIHRRSMFARTPGGTQNRANAVRDASWAEKKLGFFYDDHGDGSKRCEAYIWPDGFLLCKMQYIWTRAEGKKGALLHLTLKISIFVLRCEELATPALHIKPSLLSLSTSQIT